MCSFMITPLQAGGRKGLKERGLCQREVMSITEGRDRGGLDQGNGHGAEEAEGPDTGLGDGQDLVLDWM